MANYLMVANYHFHPVLNQRDTRSTLHGGAFLSSGCFTQPGCLSKSMSQPKKRGRALLTQFHPCLVLRTGCAFPSPRSPEVEKGRLLLHEGSRALCTLDGAGWHPGVPGEGVSPLCSLTLLPGHMGEAIHARSSSSDSRGMGAKRKGGGVSPWGRCWLDCMGRIYLLAAIHYR